VNRDRKCLAQRDRKCLAQRDRKCLAQRDRKCLAQRDRKCLAQRQVLPVELRDDLAHGLGSARGGGDDVLDGAASVPPHLTGRPVDGLLGGGGGVHRALGAGSIYKVVFV